MNALLTLFIFIVGDECQKKWKMLRDKYTAELKLQKEASKSGSEAKKRKEWYLSKQMEFLKSTLDTRRYEEMIVRH